MNTVVRCGLGFLMMTILTGVACSVPVRSSPNQEFQSGEGGPAEDWVKIEKQADPNYVKFIGYSSFCKIIWRIALKEAELSLQTLCQRVPMEKQLPLITQTLRTLSESEEGLRRESYQVHLCCFNEIDQRISLAAFRSELWDARRGQATRKSQDETLVVLLNEQNLYPEIKNLFKNFGYEAIVFATTKSQRLPAKFMPYFDWLKGQGVDDQSVLPIAPVIQWKITRAHLETPTSTDSRAANTAHY